MHKALIAIFPVLLVVFEAGLRFLLKMDTWEFIGPTLSIAALTFLIPLTKVRTKVIYTQDQTQKAEYDDDDFISFIVLCIVIYIFMWGLAFYLSANKPVVAWYGLPAHSVIGSGLYVGSMILTAWKDRK